MVMIIIHLQKSFSQKDEKKFWFSDFEAKNGYTKNEMDIYLSPSTDKIFSKKIN
jgi:hypothetical protein